MTIVTRGITHLFLAASALTAVITVARAEDSAGSPSWRDALLADAMVVYQAQAQATEETKPPPSGPLSETGRRRILMLDDDVVMLPEMHVSSEPIDLRALMATLRREAALSRAPVLPNWIAGTVYEHDFGKVHLGVYSFLGIPFLAGFSW